MGFGFRRGTAFQKIGSYFFSTRVRKLKQESTVFSWRLYDSMLRKYFWKEKTLWSDGYFVCSIGEANPNTVIEYIRNQG